MACLIDTSVLVRLANSADSFYAIATRAVMELHRRGEILHITPQNLIEFRSVATRSIAQNGLGLSPQDTEAKAVVFESAFPLLPDTPEIYPAWKALAGALNVIGKQVHGRSTRGRLPCSWGHSPVDVQYTALCSFFRVPAWRDGGRSGECVMPWIAELADARELLAAPVVISVSVAATRLPQFVGYGRIT